MCQALCWALTVGDIKMCKCTLHEFIFEKPKVKGSANDDKKQNLIKGL